MGQDRIEVIVADITTLSRDAIVNAANTTLLGGGGVDGAIHRGAGPELLVACRRLDGCPTGEARVTRGFELAAGHIIHTVGPVWTRGEAGEDQLLVACYRACLRLAEQHGFKTLAFPSISTGVYRFPKARAAGLAVGEVVAWQSGHALPELVTFCCFSQGDADVYGAVLAGS